MTPEELATTIERLMSDAGLADGVAVEAYLEDVIVRVSGQSPRQLLELLAGAGFDTLVFVTAVDYPDHVTVVYQLGHMDWRIHVTVQADLDHDAPETPSVADLWPAANWHERETYDLMGVTFAGHPDLRRLLLPEDWEGHPLRKSYEDESMERRPDYI